MKKLLLLFIAVLALSCSGDDNATTNPQTNNPENPNPENPETECTGMYVGEVSLNNQAEVDAFAANNYCGVTGNLFIGYNVEQLPTNITDLSGLASLKEITGQLVIWFNDELVNLHGLENLQKLKTLSIHSNNKLETLEHLTSLTEASTYGIVGSFIQVTSNSELKDINGLKNLENIEMLRIGSNNELLSLNGLIGLKKINKLSVTNNPKIASLSGLQNVTSSSELEFIYNIGLTDFCAITGCINESTLLSTQNNAYNPTAADIIAGNCSQ